MPRPKTKGEPVLFRLPVHLYDLVVELAAERGMTPSAYVEELTCEHLSAIDTRRSGGGKPYLGNLSRT